MLQRELFTENFEEGKLVTSTFLLQSIVAAVHENPTNAKSKPLATRTISKTVKEWVSTVVEESMKKKRDRSV